MRFDGCVVGYGVGLGVLMFSMGCRDGAKDADSDPDLLDTEARDTALGDSGESGDSGEGGDVEIGTYCEFNDPELADCDPERTYDPWIAGTGEVPYWIQDKKTEAFPFTADDDDDVWYGYLQITSPELARETTEDLFHVWFSETPNGPRIEGEACERYVTRAEFDFYWTFKEGKALESVCHLGAYPRLMYVNFETRCHPDYFEGLCDDDNKNKSDRDYQFDVARRLKKY